MNTFQLLLEPPNVWLFVIAVVTILGAALRIALVVRKTPSRTPWVEACIMSAMALLLSITINKAVLESQELNMAVKWYQTEEEMNILKHGEFFEITKVKPPQQKVEVRKRLLEKALFQSGWVPVIHSPK